MLTRESLFVILYSLPVYQLLFYTIQLITLKRSNPSRRYLGLVMLTMTLFLVINAVYHLGYDNQMIWLYYFFVPLLLSLLPVHYLYILSMARENSDIDSRSRFLLFLPPIVIFMLNLIIYRALTGPEKMILLQNGFMQSAESSGSISGAVLLHWSGMAGLLLLQLVLALAGGYKVLRKEVLVMHEQPRHLAYLQLRWILIISLCVAVFLVSGSLLNLFGPAKNLSSAIIYNVLMLICGGLTGYYGMKQDTLLNQVSKVYAGQFTLKTDAKKPVELSPEEQADPVIPAFLNEEEIQLIIERLGDLMKEEKPYLNPDFSMNDLCMKLNINRRKVTFVINEVMRKNFYGVINDYRIEEAIRLLGGQDIIDFKMDTLAEKVGFQSKSSFYACFKKYTGLTPTEYRLSRRR